MRIQNRWFQLVAAVIAMVMIANLQYAWTLFVKPVQAGTGWKLSDIQWAFTLFILFQTWVQPVQGWLIDRLGPRIFTSVAAILCAIGWGGLGMAPSLPAFWALYITAGIGAALVYGGCIGSALKWFTDRRGLAAGVIAGGYGGGAALFTPMIAWVLAHYGYRQAFLWTGLLQGGIILIVAQFLRHPAPSAQPASMRTAAPSATIGSRQFTTGEMLRTPQFYLLYAMFLMMATGGLLVTANSGPMAASWGISVGFLTLATSLNALANGTSRIFWGWASDKIGRETAMAVAFLLQAVCLMLVLTLGRQSGILFTVTLVCVYLTWGEVFSLFPSLVGDYYGAKHATSNYGVMYSAKGVASIIGGGTAALLYESFGSWDACFYGSAALALGAAIMAFGLRASVAAPRAARVGVPA
ncbi:MAG TPA: oxalate/formate MFS antiporter [Vicinamibacterales bacterium]|jgi:MFS transporter, OFA family, oxalate/formate antiporter|nr:oxalate/formate MFS antiporter [Vicinamibacterales bacterium]